MVWLQQAHHASLKGLLTWSHVVLALKSPEVGESQLGEHLKKNTFQVNYLSHSLLLALVPQYLGDPSDGIVRQ